MYTNMSIVYSRLNSSGHLIFLFIKYGKLTCGYKILGLEGSSKTPRLANLIF